MRQADFSFATASRQTSNLQYVTSAAATLPTRASSPALPTSGAASFSTLFGEVRNDVQEFIRNGSSDVSTASMQTPMSTLSAEGQIYRQRLQSSLSADNVSDGKAQQEFLASISLWAQEAGKRLGVSGDLVAAHAALESGWGQRPLRQADGSDSNNLFALKATGNWRGNVAQSLTTEYENGNAVKKTEGFRSYPDKDSAFKDYAQLLLNNPRYRTALNAGSDAHAFAQGLARGGYASDPAYADKLVRIANQIQAGKQQSHAATGGKAALKLTAAPHIDQSGD